MLLDEKGKIAGVWVKVSPKRIPCPRPSRPWTAIPKWPLPLPGWRGNFGYTLKFPLGGKQVIAQRFAPAVQFADIAA